MSRASVLTVIAILLAGACSTSSPSRGAPGKVELVASPASGDLVAYVTSEVRRGDQDRVPVLVYVGATWCEPCREFHAAAMSGKLDAVLGPLRLLEFDLDRDGTRLAAAGYRSELVPLFARPRSDGSASGSQTDGVKKGHGYVDQLTPRIRALVAAPTR